jgi:hypothetical protein
MDYNTRLRVGASAGNLTGDETLTAFSLAPMVNPLQLHVYVPSVSDGDTLVVVADFKDADDNSLQQNTYQAISEAGHYYFSFFCDDLDLAKLSVTLNATADDTEAMNFGEVDVNLTEPAHRLQNG